MVGFDDAVVIGAVSSAAASVAALVAALLDKARHHERVHVNVDGKSFQLEGVDPAEVEAALEGLRRKGTSKRGRPSTETS